MIPAAFDYRRPRTVDEAISMLVDEGEDAKLLACDIAEASGALLVEDSLDLATCEGAATIGLETIRGSISC